MSEQLTLFDVAPRIPLLRPATVALGRKGVAECRAVLAAAEKPLDSAE